MHEESEEFNLLEKLQNETTLKTRWKENEGIELIEN